MTGHSADNERILKNTSFLYLRMLFKTLVGLYTSRIVLEILGIENFGIYSVVGGIVTMLGVINTSMAAATGRFFTFGLVRNDTENLAKMFSTAWRVHLLIAALFIILAEIIGLWFLSNKIQIPATRTNAAFWVFQCSSLVMVLSIMNVPYNAAIIAHEKMGVFAYISIAETCLKLLIVYMLQYSQIDRLVSYAILTVIVQLIIIGCYVLYCKRHFGETRIRSGWDKKIFSEMGVFAGWDLYGNFCVVGKTQGINILLNLFFSTVQNAAFGIAGQVQNTVMQFANNVVTAVRPQIIKSFSAGNHERMNRLICRGTLFISLLFLTLAAPVIIEAPYLLELWLKKVPDSAVSFCRLALLSNLFIPATMLLVAGIHATGKIKGLSLLTGSIYLSVLPLSYIAFKHGAPPPTALLLNIALTFIGVLSNAWILHKHVQSFPFTQFIRKALLATVALSLLYLGLLYGITMLMQPSFIRLITVCLFSLALLLVAGLSMMRNDERAYIFRRIKKHIKE